MSTGTARKHAIRGLRALAETMAWPVGPVEDVEADRPAPAMPPRAALDAGWAEANRIASGPVYDRPLALLHWWRPDHYKVPISRRAKRPEMPEGIDWPELWCRWMADAWAALAAAGLWASARDAAVSALMTATPQPLAASDDRRQPPTFAPHPTVEHVRGAEGWKGLADRLAKVRRYWDRVEVECLARHLDAVRAATGQGDAGADRIAAAALQAALTSPAEALDVISAAGYRVDIGGPRDHVTFGHDHRSGGYKPRPSGEALNLALRAQALIAYLPASSKARRPRRV